MSATASLGIVASGLSSALQDRGRLRLRRLGIPWAGTLADPWRRIANTLVGNPIEAPVIETFEAGLTVEAHEGAIRVAGVGDLTLSHHRDGDAPTRIAPWRSVVLRPGERLRIDSTGRFRVGLLALAGVDIAAHHGSCSSYPRAGLGGLNGGVLKPGDRLPVAQGAGGRATDEPGGRTSSENLGIDAADLHDCTALARTGALEGALTLRAVPGPQDDAFDADQHARFFSEQGWRIGNGTDRMGCRLEGTALQHREGAGADIVSDAILPGSVQVPGTGQPIVLLNDAHTAGGYTKIATVVSADLMPLALARPGTAIRFTAVDAAEGVGLARQREALLVAILSRLHRVASVPDTASLLRANLIGGAIDALADPFSDPPTPRPATHPTPPPSQKAPAELRS